MKNDIKYIIKKIIIGVGIATGIMFVKSLPVFAEENEVYYGLDSKYNNSDLRIFDEMPTDYDEITILNLNYKNDVNYKVHLLKNSSLNNAFYILFKCDWYDEYYLYMTTSSELTIDELSKYPLAFPIIGNPSSRYYLDNTKIVRLNGFNTSVTEEGTDLPSEFVNNDTYVINGKLDYNNVRFYNISSDNYIQGYTFSSDYGISMYKTAIVSTNLKNSIYKIVNNKIYPIYTYSGNTDIEPTPPFDLTDFNNEVSEKISNFTNEVMTNKIFIFIISSIILVILIKIVFFFIRQR